MPGIPFASFTLLPIETGRFRLDGGAMFGVVPKPLWSRNAPADDTNRISMTMRALCLRAGERIVLVDSGVGGKSDEKFSSMFAIDFSEVELLSTLRAYGISPDMITDVILTHAHFDHIGGCTRMEGGEPVLQFPRAIHYIQREQWEWAMAPSERDRASFLPQNLLPLAESGRLQLLDGPESPIPGLSLDIVHGHTFAQQLVRIHDGERSILYCADLIPMSNHIPLPYIMGYDLQPLRTLEEKRTLLERAARDDDILLFEHDPSVEAATVMETPRGYAISRKGSLSDLVLETGA